LDDDPDATALITESSFPDDARNVTFLVILTPYVRESATLA